MKSALCKTFVRNVFRCNKYLTNHSPDTRRRTSGFCQLKNALLLPVCERNECVHMGQCKSQHQISLKHPFICNIRRDGRTDGRSEAIAEFVQLFLRSCKSFCV